MRPNSSRGFSVFELLVALGILSIISATAVPATRSMRISVERGEALNQLEFDLRRIRTEAVATGLLAVFRINPDGKTYTTGFDLLPYASPPAIEEVAFSSKLPNSVSLTSATAVYFDSRGFLVNASSDPTTCEIILSSEGSNYAHIFVTPTGALDVYND
jgi:prepilin-type N-terminal cleavage/methylation domain-containing protein